MKINKWSSVLTRLAVSYISVVFVIVLSLCSVFYLYSSGRHMDELQSRSQTTLANTARTIDSEVLQRVQRVALGLALDKTSDLRQFQGGSWKTQPGRLLELQQLLKSEVSAQPDLIEAIHLYDPQSGAILSSLHGLIDRADRERSMPLPVDWVQEMSGSGNASLWTPSRPVAEDPFSELPNGSRQQLLTYAHSYPLQSSGADSDLILAIDVKEDAIRDIVRNMMPFQYEETWALGSSDGLVIASEEAAGDGTGLAGGFASLSEEDLSEGRRNPAGGRAERDSYTVFYAPLPTTGWTLYSATPHSVFQEQSLAVQRLVLTICALALLLGLLLSGVMTKLIYSPLKRLVVKIRHLAGQPAESDANEYGMIDTAISRLSDKVSTLEETLRETDPIVKRNLMLKLLKGDSAEMSPKERLLLSDLFGESGSFRCLLLHADGTADSFGSDAKKRTPSAIAALLERMETEDGLIVAEELPERKVAAILVRRGSRARGDDRMRNLAQEIRDLCERELQIVPRLSWGAEVGRPEELHLSRGEAESYLKYAYFLPDRPILHDPGLLEREDSREEIPQPTLARFKEKLPGRQFDEIAAAVDLLIEEMREGTYSADYCHFILSNLVFAYSDHLKSVRYKPAGGGHPDLRRQYIGMAHIGEFRGWLLDSIAAFLAETEKRSGERATDTLESAKRYISENLSGDLSLEAVSSQVYLSAKYLSRLFKEELGVTYTEYVTGLRMETAKTLLERGGMTIEQVAGEVGYATTAYFIKKFKEAYGCTPGNYLRESLKQAKSS
ncbi:AraC family transcriptional regulator [Saccharibacillus alkalitolerans]|uniref:AraC family transcriptional regulator n=1 Tax=Saccharibacillus alkalitolerans TaxID=2705290 RepID=A0ABX0F6D8_9BACL|nr:AraC family transcriptional regulator [Saccharibacillus alkalitolerans]NGZ76516.1 AraC family transcriptional regulator [Saccharibacillus alkalitolerans]